LKKKPQQTFNYKSFLLLFFKKDVLAFFLSQVLKLEIITALHLNQPRGGAFEGLGALAAAA
jgi:hypothetical protein